MPRMNIIRMNKKTMHLKGDFVLNRFSFLTKSVFFFMGRNNYCYLKLNCRIQKSPLKAECEGFFFCMKKLEKN